MLDHVLSNPGEPDFSSIQSAAGAGQDSQPSNRIRHKLAFKPIVEFLDEKQHHQTLIWKCLKRYGVNGCEYLRGTAFTWQHPLHADGSPVARGPRLAYLKQMIFAWPIDFAGPPSAGL
jgi:hypothetical protein